MSKLFHARSIVLGDFILFRSSFSILEQVFSMVGSRVE